MAENPPPFEILSYSDNEIESALVRFSGADPEIVQKKLHLVYFREYFKELDAKTVVVEKDYVDRDYLEDYSAYYVRCYQRYKRRCARLHFFSSEFTEADFAAFLEGVASPVTPETLQASYLGFVVLKPLPQTIVGRTCLGTYPEAGGQRNYPIKVRYTSNLFGTPLTVNSLAFQEQDCVVAACATSALWSAFHSTGHQFQHSVPTPVEITRSATDLEPTPSRSFPNVDGLNGTQMARAIRNVGLEPYLEKATDTYVLQSAAYAYLREGIPIVLGLHLLDVSVKPTPKYIGKHAVTLVGYSAGAAKPTPLMKTDFLNRSTLVDKLYAHDDQVGPFSRMVLSGNATLNGQSGSRLQLSWRGQDGVLGSIVGLSEIMLIPLYNKIRIPYRSVHDLVLLFDRQLKEIVALGIGPTKEEYIWDIHLTDCSEIKQCWGASPLAVGEARSDVLTCGLPRFVWRAVMLGTGGTPKLELVFDATDINQGSSLYMVRVFDPDLGDLLRAAAKHTGFKRLVLEEAQGAGWQIFKKFSE